MTDKLREAVKEVINAIKLHKAHEHFGNYCRWRDSVLHRLEKALEPEPEFWPGQHVVASGGFGWSIYLRYDPDYHVDEPHLVYSVDSDCLDWFNADELKPIDDWQPPGFAKKPDAFQIEDFIYRFNVDSSGANILKAFIDHTWQED